MSWLHGGHGAIPPLEPSRTGGRSSSRAQEPAPKNGGSDGARRQPATASRALRVDSLVPIWGAVLEKPTSHRCVALSWWWGVVSVTVEVASITRNARALPMLCPVILTAPPLLRVLSALHTAALDRPATLPIWDALTTTGTLDVAPLFLSAASTIASLGPYRLTSSALTCINVMLVP